jgi:hypothetical protein
MMVDGGKGSPAKNGDFHGEDMVIFMVDMNFINSMGKVP